MDEERSAIFVIALVAALLLGFEIYSFSYISNVRANNYEQLEEASEKIEEYRAKKEALVEKGKKKDAVCYVDGVKQDTDFDPDGLNLDNYEVEYKENRLYFKKVTNSQDSTSHHTSFFPMFLPVFSLIVFGHSPSGKARDFDSRIRWFESDMPSSERKALAFCSKF